MKLVYLSTVAGLSMDLMVMQHFGREDAAQMYSEFLTLVQINHNT